MMHHHTRRVACIRRHHSRGSAASGWARIQSGNGIVGVPAALGDTTGANLIVVCFSLGASGNTESITDNKGNIYTQLAGATKVSGIAKHEIYYKINPIVGAGHTVTLLGNSTFGSISVEAWQCTKGTPIFDVVSTPQGTLAGSLTVSTGSATPSKVDSLAFAAATGQGTTLLINSGFTIGATRVGIGGTNYASALAYKPVAFGAENAAWSWAAGGGDNAASLTFFKY